MPIMTVHFYSPALQMASVMHVALPTDGSPNGTLFLLGPEGSASAWWLRHARLEEMAERRRLALVLPSALQGCGFDMAYGYRFEQSLCTDIPDWLETQLPCLRLRERPRYLAGLRLSGTGAIHAALRHPGRFEAVGAFCAPTDIAACFDAPDGYLTPKRLRSLWGEAPAAGSPLDLPALARVRAEEGALPRLFFAAASAEADAFVRACGKDVCHVQACGDADSPNTPEICLNAFLDFCAAPAEGRAEACR